MYVPNPGDYIQAFDAKTGEALWEYKRQYAEGVNGGTNRNMAIWGTTLIDAGADNMMYAVDARTGKLVWETKVLDPKLPARATAGPIVANGKVITGRQCQPARDERLVHHHRARRGDGQGAVAHAHDSAAPASRATRPGATCRWSSAGTSAPGWCRATTPSSNRIYIGTSVTIPAPKFILGGNDKQHLYHNSTLALDPANRQDRLVLPASDRSLGSRSSVRAAARRHGRGA